MLSERGLEELKETIQSKPKPNNKPHLNKESLEELEKLTTSECKRSIKEANSVKSGCSRV